MRPNKDPNHLHKLKRHRYSTGKAIYFCVNDCSFRISCEFSLGKAVECWRCGRAFKMNSYSITLDKPHCENCHLHKGEIKPKGFKRKEDKVIQPLAAIANLAGSDVVDNLKQRLNAISATPEVKAEEAKHETVQIKEFQIEEEEFL